jgi:NAD(P)-dependent dehydrogenase (short-subunit alcohol dehydrogenase family)
MSGPASHAKELAARSSLDVLTPTAVKKNRRWGQAFNLPLQDWRGKRVWLVGASSGIGLACAQALQAAGAHLVISARDLGALSDWAKQSDSEGKRLELFPLDVTNGLQVTQVAQEVLANGAIDMLLYCAGHYRAQRATEFDLSDMLRHQEVNYNGVLRVLGETLPVFLHQGFGHISLVSSVAAWRGLPNGLAYGPTKAAMTHLAETLYMDLQDRNIGVSLISPGFVATPLTAQNNFQMPALLSPEQAAQAMLKGWADGEFDIHFPKRFTLWLKIMRLIPYRMYFALVRRFTGL